MNKIGNSKPKAVLNLENIPEMAGKTLKEQCNLFNNHCARFSDTDLSAEDLEDQLVQLIPADYGKEAAPRITEYGTELVFRRLRVRQGTGSDGRRSWVYKRNCKSLSVPYTVIFQRSIDEGRYVRSYKISAVCAIPKVSIPR
jgi:hypothetical protein